MSLVGKFSHGQVARSEPVTFMSYNIRYLNNSDGLDVWSNRKATVIEEIDRRDIVGVQECVGQQLDDIRSGTNNHQWYGVGRDDGQLKGEMTAIGWRKEKFEPLDRGTFWLSESPSIVGSRGWDAALPRIASWMRFRLKDGDHEFLFVNIHFDHRGVEARANSGKLLRTWISENHQEIPVVLVGDFNAGLEDRPLKNLLDESTESTRLLMDARSKSQVPDTGPQSTWNGFSEVVGERRIDHILYAGDLEVLDFKTLDPRTPAGRFASDHLPIEARIRF